MPSWLTRTRKPVTDDPQKFSTELSIIYKYSPFKTEAELMRQFDVIYGKCGKIIKTEILFEVFSVSYERCCMYVFIFFFLWYHVESHRGAVIYFIHISFVLREFKHSLTKGGMFVLARTWWEWMRRCYKLWPQGLHSPTPDTKVRRCLLQRLRLHDPRFVRVGYL